MERAIALVGVYELQGLIPEALEVCKSILRNDPHNQQALQMYKRLSAISKQKDIPIIISSARNDLDDKV
ncbi:hypothetical protein HSHS1_01830 [Helicobacter suis HS1]|nr:hypothetical protein HSHS1_01830 [Helicobacter suis HS1]